MPGKKAHKPRNVPGAGTHGIRRATDPARKSTGEIEGQFARDPKSRRGQYGSAGNSPLTKK